MSTAPARSAPGEPRSRSVRPSHAPGDRGGLPRARALCLGALLLGLWPAAAAAGGFTIPTIGARGSITGGFVARPDDTSAMYHNPAGLALISSGYRLDLAGTAILSHTTYRRCTRALYDAAGNPTGCAQGPDGRPLLEPAITTIPHQGYPAGFGILPYLGISGRFGLKRWNFGIGIYSPHNATGAFPDCTRDETGKPVDCSGAPQRFQAVLGTINTLYIAPTATFSPIPELHFGVSVAAVRASITSERALWLGGDKSTLDIWDWNGEGRLRLDASAWSATFNLGVIWNIGKTLAPDNPWLRGLNLGLSYSNMSWFTFHSDVQLFSPLLYNLMTENAGCRKGDADTYEVVCASTVNFTFPLQIRGGFNWRITDQVGIGFDLFWQNYRVYDEIRVQLDQPLALAGKMVEVTETVERKDSSDAFTISAGVQIMPRVLSGLTISLGIIWDQSPYPDSTYSLLSPDADKLGVALGLAYLFQLTGAVGLEVTAGYLPFFYKNRIVRDSVLRPAICPPDSASCEAIAPPADFSNNGNVLDKRVDMFTLQLGLLVF